jgi:hypothetical protein
LFTFETARSETPDNLWEITFRLTNVIPERIIFVSRGITVWLYLYPPSVPSRQDVGWNLFFSSSIPTCNRVWPVPDSYPIGTQRTRYYANVTSEYRPNYWLIWLGFFEHLSANSKTVQTVKYRVYFKGKSVPNDGSFHGISRDGAARLCDKPAKVMDKINEIPFRWRPLKIIVYKQIWKIISPFWHYCLRSWNNVVK